jgi:hypothetical protein
MLLSNVYKERYQQLYQQLLTAFNIPYQDLWKKRIFVSKNSMLILRRVDNMWTIVDNICDNKKYEL